MKPFYKFLMPLVAIVAMALPCNVQAQVTCDSGSPMTVSNADTSTTTTSYMPGYSYYNYSFSEVLILADDLMGLGEIKALQFKPASTSAGNYFNNCEIYLANTELEDLSSGFFDDASELELVWSGSMNYTTTDWQTIVFDDPFAWDGSSNIVVAVRRNHGSWSSGSSFAAYTATAQLARYDYQDSGPYTIGSLPSGTASSTVAWYKLIGCESSGPVCYRVRNLEASNITSDGVTLSWVDTLNSGVTYTIYNMADTSFVATTSSTTYTLTGLTANTAYQFGVMADCGSSYVKVSIRTACSGYAEIPYIEDFESEPTGENPPCWLQLSTGSSGAGTFPAIYVYPGNTHNGQGYFEFESTNGTEVEMVALPEMQNINGLKMLFWASSSSSFPCVLEVGVLESDGSFTQVDSIPLITFSGTDAWKPNYHEYTVYFSGYTGTGSRIAMRAYRPTGGQYTLFLDDLMVVEDNGCYPVASVNAADIDSSSIALTWTDTLNVGTNYTIAYWAVGGDTTVVNGISDTTYTALNLNANTIYSFMVTPNCTSGDGIPTIAQFRTGCGTTSIPYTEDFESYATMAGPDCWTTLSGMVYVRSNTSYSTLSHSGNNYLDFRGFASGNETQSIALPLMNQPTNELQVRFWTRPESTSSNCGTFSVGYMTDLTNDSSFVELANWAYSDFSGAAYQEKEVPMVGAPDTARIVLRHNGNSYNYYWYVDELVVEPIPTCAHPLSVSASNVTPSSADLTILGTGSSYRVYIADGTTLDSVDVTDSTYTLNTLNSSTDYTVTVVTLCDDGSLTSGVSTSFRTLCGDGGCTVTINMTDSYGDGWNGAAIKGYANGSLVFTATLSSGSTGSFSYAHCSSDTLVFVWQSGSYDDEADFVITANGLQIVSGNGDDFSGTIATLVGCPSCGVPYDIVVSAIASNGATLSWNGAGASNFRLYYTDGTTADSVDVTDTTYTFATLNASTLYTVSVATICDDGSINISNPIQFTTVCAAGGCLVDIEMVDSFGDGWNGNAITGYANGQSVFVATIESGSYNTVNYSLCSTDTLALVWTAGSYPGEASFTINFGGTPFIYGGGSDYSSGDTVMYTVGCPTCMAPTALVVDTVTADGITFHWTAGGEETAWNVYVNDSVITGLTTNSCVITGLEQYTYYTLAVRALCDVNDSSFLSSSVTVRTLVACPWPTDFSAIVTGDTVSLSWNGTATGYQLVYGNYGFNPDTVSNIINVSDSSYEVDGLASGLYHAYVRSDCGTTTSLWTGPLSFGIGYTNIDQVDTLYTCGAIICDDGGATGSYSSSRDDQVVIYPVDASHGLIISGHSHTEGSWDYVTIYEGVGTTGTVLFCDNTSGVSTDQIVGPFDVFGPVTITFHSDGSLTYPGFEIAVNCFDLTGCLRPTDVTVSDITSSSATISWTPSGDETQWEVSVNGVNALVSSTTYTATGLTSSTNYNVSVRAVCGAGDTSFATSASFTTALCDNAAVAINYDAEASATNSSYCPVGYSLYNYSYVQTIVPAERLSSLGGDITALAFNTASATAGGHFTNMTVYMANVSEDDLTDGFIHPDATHTFVKVIDSADFSYTSTGWQTHSFDTPFQWNGTSNILVAFKRDHGTWTSGSSFVAHSDTIMRTRYAYQDSGPYDINSVDAGYASLTVGDLQLISCGDACFAPSVTVSNVDDASVTLTWTGSASAYQVAAVAGIWAAPAAGTPVTGNTYTVTGLAPATQYAIGVRAVCDEGVYSEWNVVIVTTADHPCYAPTNVSASNITMDGATISWTPSEEGQTNFELRYSTAGDTTVVSVTENPYTLTGLLNATEYSVAVRAICGENNYSDWSAPYTFRTASCQVVQGVTVSDKTASTATIEWTDNGSASYEVGYGPIGTTTDNCTRRTTTTNSYTITGLEEGTNYVVYVRSICGSGVYSDWTSGTTFTTREVGIDDVDNTAISRYPNPASSTVTLTGIEGEATVTVVDMNGRVVKVIGYGLEVIDNSLTIDISDLSQGAYFVRITGERVNAIRKLIVR